MRIYRQNTQGGYGPLERTEAYWRWLVGRKAYDSLFVALDGPDKLELEESIAPIVGYAVLRQERVVELFAAPNHPTASQQLLARACSDTIEHDRQELFVHAPPDHELHQILTAAGGTNCRQEMAQKRSLHDENHRSAQIPQPAGPRIRGPRQVSRPASWHGIRLTGRRRQMAAGLLPARFPRPPRQARPQLFNHESG